MIIQKSPRRAPGVRLPSPSQFSCAPHTLPAPDHGSGLLVAGVHSNFSTTIPPTSWQADLPPHHPSSACSDGTLKLNTAASTEGMGVARKEAGGLHLGALFLLVRYPDLWVFVIS